MIGTISTSSIEIIHIENTSVCNASCPMCARNINGGELSTRFSPNSMSFEIFQNAVLPHVKSLQKIMFCGNLGDPCADNNLLEKINWIKEYKPECIIGINTNGSIQNKNWWAQAAQLLTGIYDYVVFSIDGLEDTNHIYRVGVRWNKVMENAKAYIDAGGSAHWDMLIFEHNKHQIEECQKLAKSMGFSWFRSKESARWSDYKFDHIKPVNEYQEINYASNTDVNCERDRENSLYIDYTGQYWPCCYIASSHYNSIGRDKHSDIHAYGADELMTEYKNRLLQDKPFAVCNICCGNKTNKRSQWKTELQLN